MLHLLAALLLFTACSTADSPTVSVPVPAPSPTVKPEAVPGEAEVEPQYGPTQCLPDEVLVVSCTWSGGASETVAAVCQGPGEQWPTARIGAPGAPRSAGEEAESHAFSDYVHAAGRALSFQQDGTAYAFIAEQGTLRFTMGEASHLCTESGFVAGAELRRPLPAHLCPTDCSLVFRAGTADRQVSLCDTGGAGLLVSRGLAGLPERLELDVAALADPTSIELIVEGHVWTFEDSHYRGGPQQHVTEQSCEERDCPSSDLALSGIFSRSPTCRP
jgi:hypothetical protein